MLDELLQSAESVAKNPSQKISLHGVITIGAAVSAARIGKTAPNIIGDLLKKGAELLIISGEIKILEQILEEENHDIAKLLIASIERILALGEKADALSREIANLVPEVKNDATQTH